jgi:protein-tyrosine-phosphatase
MQKNQLIKTGKHQRPETEADKLVAQENKDRYDEQTEKIQAMIDAIKSASINHHNKSPNPKGAIKRMEEFGFKFPNGFETKTEEELINEIRNVIQALEKQVSDRLSGKIAVGEKAPSSIDPAIEAGTDAARLQAATIITQQIEEKEEPASTFTKYKDDKRISTDKKGISFGHMGNGSDIELLFPRNTYEFTTEELEEIWEWNEKCLDQDGYNHIRGFSGNEIRRRNGLPSSKSSGGDGGFPEKEYILGH